MIAKILTSRGTSTTIESTDPDVGMLDAMELAEALHRPVTWVKISGGVVQGTYRHDGGDHHIVVIDVDHARFEAVQEAHTWLAV